MMSFDTRIAKMTMHFTYLVKYWPYLSNVLEDTVWIRNKLYNLVYKPSYVCRWKCKGDIYCNIIIFLPWDLIVKDSIVFII